MSRVILNLDEGAARVRLELTLVQATEAQAVAREIRNADSQNALAPAAVGALARMVSGAAALAAMDHRAPLRVTLSAHGLAVRVQWID